MKDDVLNLVCSFIADEAGINENEMEGGTMLEKDLGIYGDDACELIVKFGKHFHVDVSRFLAADYFRGEGFRLPPYWRKLLKIKYPNKKELTINHLVKAVAGGRLDESIIGS